MVSGIAIYGALGHVPPRLPTILFLVHFEVNLTANYSKCCVVCEISWCRCQQLTALSISTALVTKLIVIEPLLHSALKFAVSAPSRNKSWRRHCMWLSCGSSATVCRVCHVITVL